jgi:uncharacterized coiled-coil protein SlyX
MKFTTQIYTLITRIFGLAADSSEAEIHASLSDMKTVTEMRAEIRAEFETQLAELAALQAGDVELRTQIDTLNARITELEAQVSERDATITALNAQVVTLGKKPALEHTQGSTETPVVKETQFDANQSPYTSRARALLGFS